MSGGDLPPRQKMIGMMYLVLTALLAMNVSKSILDAFVTINNGIETTTVSFDASNGILYSQFDRAKADSPAAKKWADKADQVKKMANDMTNHIKALKSKLIEITDKKPKEVADTIKMMDVDAKDNYDEPTRIMGLAEPSTPTKVAGLEEWSGIELKERLNKYQAGIIGVFEDKDVKEGLTKKLDYLSTPKMHGHGGEGEDEWEVGLFYHIPLAAVVTMLSKIQSDVRTAESEVISKLYEQIDAGGVSFNAVQGMAVMPKAYIMEGDTFRADIFTAAYDDRVDPEIYISRVEFDTNAAYAVEKSGNFDINKIMKGTAGKKWGEGDWYQLSPEEVRAGKGNLSVKEGVGVHNWGGIIKLKTKKGPKVYPFASSFEVGKPSLAISADKMNVFYIGVDNPVSIAAPMPNFTASGAGLTKSGKGWVVRPKSPGTMKITVTGIDDVTGNKVNLGSSEFRVKRIPDPKAFCGGKSGSESIKLIQLKSASTVVAKMENFDFDINVNVNSFMFSTTKAGEVQEIKVSGNKLDGRCQSMISKAKKNQKFFIEQISCRMPDGSTRKLAPIILKVI